MTGFMGRLCRAAYSCFVMANAADRSTMDASFAGEVQQLILNLNGAPTEFGPARKQA
jgi:hypothetical protein